MYRMVRRGISIGIMIGMYSLCVCCDTHHAHHENADHAVTAAAQNMLAKRISSDTQLPTQPAYLSHFTHDELYTGLQVHTCSSIDDNIHKAYHSNTQVPVSYIEFSIYDHPLKDMAHCSVADIKKALGCSYIIHFDRNYITDHKNSTPFFLYTQLCRARQTYSAVAHVINLIRAQPEHFTDDHRTVSEVMPRDTSVLIRPEETQSWSQTLQQEIAYRRHLYHNQPMTPHVERARYWIEREQSIASHLEKIRQQPQHTQQLFDIPALQRVDSHLDAFYASPTLPVEQLSLMSWDDIDKIQRGHITASLVYHNAVLRWCQPGHERVKRI